MWADQLAVCWHHTTKSDEDLDWDVSGGAHGGGGGEGFTRCEKHKISRMRMAGGWVR